MSPVHPFPIPTQLYLNNKYVNAKSSKRLTIVNPFDETVVTTEVQCAGPEDIDIAVANARAAFKGPWSTYTGTQRAKVLNKFADLLEENANELSYLDAICMGMPVAINSTLMVPGAAGVFRYYAGWADKIAGESYDPDDGLVKIVRHTPLGICVGIAPWNFPVTYAGLKIAPALAAGNSYIHKSSEKSPLSSIAIGRLVEQAGFPPGVLQFVTGDGETGAALASHMKIDMVSFTGSTTTGRAVSNLASKSNMKRVTLELGGKSAALVFDDADIPNAVGQVSDGFLFNSGQVCIAMSRLFVQETIVEGFVAAVKERFDAINKITGPDPRKPTTMYGPMANKDHFNRVMKYVDIGKKTAEVGYGASQRGTKGYFVTPTIFLNPSVDNPIRSEEIFGPVLAINTFKTVEEAVALANDTDTGLAASLYTSDLTRALAVAPKLEAGSVSINVGFFPNMNVPFGGFKQSGSGKELGKDGLMEYMNTQSILINMNMPTKPKL